MKKSLYIFVSALFSLTTLVLAILYTATFFDNTASNNNAAVEVTLSYNYSAEQGAFKKIAHQKPSEYQQSILLESIAPGKYHIGVAGLERNCKLSEPVETLKVFANQNKNNAAIFINCNDNSYDFNDLYITLKDRDSKISLFRISKDSPKAKSISVKNYSVTGSSNNQRLVFSIDGNIAVLSTQNTEIQQLTSMGRDSQPSWSPDGTTIAFSSSRNGNKDIYSINADGRNLRRLTNNKYTDTAPIWSPDGLKIAFNSDRGGDSEVFVLYPQTKKTRQITNNNQDDYVESWSPSGRSFVVLTEGWFGFNKICVVGFNGDVKRRITHFASGINKTNSSLYPSSKYSVSYTDIMGARRKRELQNLQEKENENYLTQLYR